MSSFPAEYVALILSVDVISSTISLVFAVNLEGRLFGMSGNSLIAHR